MARSHDPARDERELVRRLPWFARLYLWACHRLYNEFAWTYDWVSWLVSLGHWWDWRLAALGYIHPPDVGSPPLLAGEPLAPLREATHGQGGGSRVLEVGFGTGDLLVEMARRGLDVWGLDLSPAMHRITTRKLRRRGVWAPLVRAFVQQMPFPDRAFDAIVATFPAEFILQGPALREFARVLRPGGRLVVAGASVAVNAPVLSQALALLFGSAAAQRPGLNERIERAGLRVTIVEPGGRFVSPQIIIADKAADH
ncbi:MAG: class I SAM-dependent methyltransferase [Chloroflexi bacterium]|nr:class I SAM-dependent methyltransferase [Chloroflexota bacterium]